MVVPMVASFSRREWPQLATESYAEDSGSDLFLGRNFSGELWWFIQKT